MPGSDSVGVRQASSVVVGVAAVAGRHSNNHSKVVGRAIPDSLVESNANMATAKPGNGWAKQGAIIQQFSQKAKSVLVCTARVCPGKLCDLVGRLMKRIPVNQKAMMLSILAAVLLVALPWVLGSQVPGYSSARFISELGAFDMPNRSVANGAFLLIGAFWMGAVEATRKALEPAKMDPWVRFGAIAFAASYIASVVFPCDLGCPATGSGSQLVHSTLIWVLSAGAVVAGVKLSPVPSIKGMRVLKGTLLLFFLVMQLAAWQRDWLPGVWQRLFELNFAVLWVLWLWRLPARPARH